MVCMENFYSHHISQQMLEHEYIYGRRKDSSMRYIIPQVAFNYLNFILVAANINHSLFPAIGMAVLVFQVASVMP